MRGGGDYVPRNARRRRRVAERAEGVVVVAADTIVVAGADYGEAAFGGGGAEMLRALSGVTHQVISAFCGGRGGWGMARRR